MNIFQIRDIFGLNTDSSDEEEDKKKTEMDLEEGNNEPEKENEKEEEEEPPIGKKQGKMSDKKQSSNPEWIGFDDDINNCDEPEKEFKNEESTAFTAWEEKNETPFTEDNPNKNYGKQDNL